MIPGTTPDEDEDGYLDVTDPADADPAADQTEQDAR